MKESVNIPYNCVFVFHLYKRFQILKLELYKWCIISEVQDINPIALRKAKIANSFGLSDAVGLILLNVSRRGMVFYEMGVRLGGGGGGGGCLLFRA